MKLSRALPVVAGLVVLAFVLYANTLRGPFQFDDGTSILENESLRSGDPRAWWAFWPGRLVAYTTLGVDRRLHGLDAPGYHFTNVLIHALAGLAVLWLVWELARLAAPRRDAGLLAAVAAALFVAHPLQTQAVAYITQRMASLYTLFYVTAVAAHLRGLARRREGKSAGWTLPAGLGSGLLAVLSKEPALTLPLAILLADAAAAPGLAGRWRRVAPYLPLALVPAATALLGGGRFGAGEATLTAQTTAVTRTTYLFTEWEVLARYLRLLVAPVGQNVDPDVAWQRVPDAAVLGCGAVHVALLALAAWWWRRGARLPAFAVAWWYLVLAPESSIFPIADAMAEHRLYAAMPAFALAVALPLESLARRRRALAIVAVIVALAALGTLTVERNRVWRTPYALWQDALAKSPGKGRPYAALGWLHAKAGRYEQARERLERAVALDPGDPQAWNNLGNTALALGDLPRAAQAYREAARLRPREATPWLNLAAVEERRGRLDEARRALEACLAGDPGNAAARARLESLRAPRR